MFNKSWVKLRFFLLIIVFLSIAFLFTDKKPNKSETFYPFNRDDNHKENITWQLFNVDSLGVIRFISQFDRFFNKSLDKTAQVYRKKEKTIPEINPRLIDDRFLVVGKFPEEQLKKLTDDFKNGTPDSKKIIILEKPFSENNIPNNKPVTRSLQASGNLTQGYPDVPDDPYCIFNTNVTDQCGGGSWDKSQPRYMCKANVTLAFDEACNYGNYPEYSTQYPLPPDYKDVWSQCSAVRSCPGCCFPTVTVPQCGNVLHCWVGMFCEQVLPVTCEQCCDGAAWIWDTVTGGCGCATAG